MKTIWTSEEIKYKFTTIEEDNYGDKDIKNYYRDRKKFMKKQWLSKDYVIKLIDEMKIYRRKSNNSKVDWNKTKKELKSKIK